MRQDEDNTEPRYQRYADQAMRIAVEFNSAGGAFLQPEILALDPPRDVVRWIEQLPELEVYRHHLDNILRMKPHTLPAEQEELLAAAGELAQAPPGNIFQMFNNADLKFPPGLRTMKANWLN